MNGVSLLIKSLTGHSVCMLIKEESMSKRIVLTATEGNILTDGTVYGSLFYLEEGRAPEEFREITNEEYEKILKGDEKNVLI